MNEFIIVETDQGLAIVQKPQGSDAEEVAASHGALLVDGGPYQSFEEAQDALINIPVVAEEEAAPNADQGK